MENSPNKLTQTNVLEKQKKKKMGNAQFDPIPHTRGSSSLFSSNAQQFLNNKKKVCKQIDG